MFSFFSFFEIQLWNKFTYVSKKLRSEHALHICGITLEYHKVEPAEYSKSARFFLKIKKLRKTYTLEKKPGW